MLLAGIYDLLKNDAGMIAALHIGSRADGTTGVFPGLAEKQATLPYVVFSQVGLNPVTSFGGINRFQTARLRFVCCGASYLTAQSVAKALRNVLDGLLGTLSDGSRVEGAEICFQGDDNEADTQGTIFKTVCDFYVNYVDLD